MLVRWQHHVMRLRHRLKRGRLSTFQGHRICDHGLGVIGVNGSVHPRTQQIAVTMLGHPAGSGKMTVVDTLGAFAILVWINPEQDADDLRPLRSLLRCVE